jgi:hypothetical protein
MQERDAVRSRAFLEARIRLQNRTMSVDCVVRNISLSGAKLEVDATCERVLSYWRLKERC